MSNKIPKYKKQVIGFPDHLGYHFSFKKVKFYTRTKMYTYIIHLIYIFILSYLSGKTIAA